MVVAKSFTIYARRQETKSPHPVKLSKVDEDENNLKKDLRDFVALNLHALADKEGIEVVLRNAVMVTNKRSSGCDSIKLIKYYYTLLWMMLYSDDLALSSPY